MVQQLHFWAQNQRRQKQALKEVSVSHVHCSIIHHSQVMVKDETEQDPSWKQDSILGQMWTLSSMPSIYGNDIQTGKPDSRMEEPQGSYLESLLPKGIP